MLCVHNDIVHAVDQTCIVALVLLGLSAAFDTVDHATLLSVLQTRFGVDGVALTWFKSNLSDRFQTFQVSGAMSEPVAIDCSVPHGSVLGPVKFISYTDGVTSVFKKHEDITCTPMTSRAAWMCQSPISPLHALFKTVSPTSAVSVLRDVCSPTQEKPSLSGLARDRVYRKRTMITLRYSSSLAVLSRSASCATLVYCLTVNLP